MNQKPQQPSPDAAGNAAPYATHYVIDEYHQGMTVSAFNYPQGWQAHSRVIWNFEDTSQPLTAYASVFNPRGAEAVEFLTHEACFWLSPGPIIYTPGQKWRGMTCLPPMSAPDALLKFGIPKHRGHVPNLRVIYVRAVPNMAQMFDIKWLLNVRNEGVMARVEYELNGRTVEEDFFACVMWHPPNGEQLNWGIAKFFSLRAARGELDSVGPELWSIVASLRGNPQWTQLYEQIMQQLSAQVQGQFAAWKVKHESEKAWGRQMQEYREWESDLRQQTTNDWWASQDRLSERRGEALGGYQRFHDPNSAYGVHRDYSLSQYAWTNGYRWIHSNEALYDPNTDPNESRNGPWTLQNRI